MKPRPRTRKELRTFGLTLACVCLVWAAILFLRGHGGGRWFLAAAPVLALLGLALPRALWPLHVVWMPVAHGIARVLTWLLLTLVYYLVFTPYALALRLLGKDPLTRRFEPDAPTYWIRREREPFDKRSLTRQY